MPASSSTNVDQLDHDLKAEQRHLQRSHDALTDMRHRAQRMYEQGEQVIGDSYSAERLGVTLRQRIAELADQPDAPIFFGRLDFDECHSGADHDEDGTRHYIGRRHVVDGQGIPLVLDWRAPISRAFYRASAKDPQGVIDRRRFGFHRGELTSFEDEHLTQGEELGTKSSILTDEIERPRVGPMRDIVATIQPEQDELVRADLDVSICVQGAPGTGKTAVGLHRAAFLLYAHRERLKRSKVLIVGPNRALLAYISGVLPALGEIDVDQASVDDLVARVVVRAVDTPEAALVKHDERMAEVLRRALWSRVATQRDQFTSIDVPDGARRWRLDVTAQRRVAMEVKAERPAYGLGRERLRARLVALLARRAEAVTGAAASESWSKRVARNASLTAFLNEVWPATTPEGLVAGLLGDRPALAVAAEGILTDAEIDAVTWAKAPRSAKAASWSAADLWLLDEAAGLIQRAEEYGHVVIDEAQDLSPMQCRALARRSAHSAVTVLGDLAQGTSPWASATWTDTMTWLGKPGAEIVSLTTGFRVPAVVMDFANRLVPQLNVDVPPATSLRRDGSLEVEAVTDRASSVVAAARAGLDHEGSIGVIVPDSLVRSTGAALTSSGLGWNAPDDLEASERITLVPATTAKGLEYDHVIVLEPAAILREEAKGVNRLYVVLTRAVSRLVVLHAEPLPGALAP